MTQENTQQPNTGLAFVGDYQPGVGFRPVSRIQQPTVNQILGYVDPANPDGGDGAVVDPTDWNGYVVNYLGCGPGNYNLVFLREGLLQQGQTYSFTTDAVYFSHRLQLLEARIQRGAGQAGQQAGAQGETTGQGEAETTTQEATTQETTAPEGTPTTEQTTTAPEGTTTTTTETTATETTTTNGTTETTTPTADGTTTTPVDGTTTPPDEATTAAETTEQVIVNATETENG
ncbi:hypothetical protein M0R89_00095 [Halorussus limi]|uniref:Uncharacterized protein n=1 Tax=Halorussus limi TaxID=2938695 RepID=A0A8U0HUA2_9EURY|nr:hypothetical protein [Halorussus limi]UPV74487.1 hypothetical protein M0R89_00095 [Halorussus limi]